MLSEVPYVENPAGEEEAAGFFMQPPRKLSIITVETVVTQKITTSLGPNGVTAGSVAETAQRNALAGNLTTLGQTRARLRAYEAMATFPSWVTGVTAAQKLLAQRAVNNSLAFFTVAQPAALANTQSPVAAQEAIFYAATTATATTAPSEASTGTSPVFIIGVAFLGVLMIVGCVFYAQASAAGDERRGLGAEEKAAEEEKPAEKEPPPPENAVEQKKEEEAAKDEAVREEAAPKDEAVAEEAKPAEEARPAEEAAAAAEEKPAEAAAAEAAPAEAAPAEAAPAEAAPAATE